MTDLYNHQIKGSEWLCEVKKGILAFDTRLGKTLTAYEAVKRIKPKNVILLRPKSAIEAWVRTVPEIADWRCFTYEKFSIDSKVDPTLKNCDVLICDEAHFLRNRKTQKFDAIKKINSQYTFLLTATPLVNDSYDLWSLLHLCDKKKFSSYWKFAMENYHVTIGQWGNYEVGSLKDEDQLRSLIEKYMYRKSRETFGISREMIRLNMDTQQERIYHQVMKNGYFEEKDVVLLAPTIFHKLTRFRQITACPKIIHPSLDEGAILSWFDEERLPDRFAVFSTYNMLFEHLAKVLDRTVFIGKENADQFQNYRGKAAILCNIKSSNGFSLDTADAAFIISPSWTPADNVQAESRIISQQQRSEKKVFYFIINNTMDHFIYEVIKGKKVLMSSIVDYLEKTVDNL